MCDVTLGSNLKEKPSMCSNQNDTRLSRPPLTKHTAQLEATTRRLQVHSGRMLLSGLETQEGRQSNWNFGLCSVHDRKLCAVTAEGMWGFQLMRRSTAAFFRE